MGVQSAEVGGNHLLGKRKHTPPCSSVELVVAENEMGATEERFLGFHRVFVSTTGLESFSLRPGKVPKRFSFVGGSVRFFLL